MLPFFKNLSRKCVPDVSSYGALCVKSFGAEETVELVSRHFVRFHHVSSQLFPWHILGKETDETFMSMVTNKYCKFAEDQFLREILVFINLSDEF